MPTRTILATFAVVVAIAVAACGGSSSVKYPANVQSNFLNACEVQGQVSTCDCALSYIEAHVSLSKFQAADNAVNNGGAQPKFLYSALGACAG